MKSTQNKFVQVSDAFIGLLGDLFYFLDNLSNDHIHLLKDGKHQLHLENIQKVSDLINRSNTESPLLIKNCNDISRIIEREVKMSNLDNIRR